MAGHKFWCSKRKRSGLQQFVFSRADKLEHRVCVVLEHYGRRLYTSFADVSVFWDYYSAYRGKRCFYWINRSFEVSREASLLHFDLEWYTDLQDTQVAAKLLAVRNAINTALPRKVKILEEDLSRRLPIGKFKNSFHGIDIGIGQCCR